MTKEIPTVRLVHGQGEQIVNGIIGLASIALTYYVLHPSQWEQHSTIVRRKWQTLKYQLSVLRALDAIRSLPETDNRQ